MIDRNVLIRRLSFAAYFVAAFLVFLLILFPFERVKSKLESEVSARTPVDLSVGRISPRFFNKFLLSDVVITDKQGQVLFESTSVNASVSLFSLLRGVMAVNIKAAAYGGSLLIKLKQDGGSQYVMLDADGMDVSSYTLLKNLGFKIGGKIGGNFEMNDNSGRGRIWVKGVSSRELKIKGFTIPDLDFDKGWIEGEVKADRLSIRKLELDGKDLKVRVAGDLVARERGMVNLTIRFKPSERLAYEQSALLSMLKNRDPEGYYQVSLGGTLSQPVPRF